VSTPSAILRSEGTQDRPPTLPGNILGAVLLPVSFDGALAWAAGEISDDDLAAECTMTPGAIFAVDLADRAGWRSGLEQCRFWFGLGASFMVTGTRVPMLLARYRRAGMAATFRDPDGRVRLAAEAPALGQYLRRYVARIMAPACPA
jgi:hypothetical protein